jgi:hypothetical protein
MSPEQEDATRTALVANLMLTLKRGDARRTAAGLIALASVLVDGDVVGRIALAEIARAMATELESGIGQPPQPTHSSVVQFARRQ